MSDSEVEGPVKRQKTAKNGERCYDCGSSHWRTLRADLRDEDGILFCRRCFQRREEEGGDSPRYSPTSPSYAPTSPHHEDDDVSQKSTSYSDVEEANTPIPEEPLSPTSPIPEHPDEYPEEEPVEEQLPQPVAKEPVEEQVPQPVAKEPVEEEVEEEDPSALPVPFYEPVDEGEVKPLLEEVNVCSRGERLFTCPRCRLQVIIVGDLTGVTVCLECKAPVCLACGKLGGHPGYSCK